MIKLLRWTSRFPFSCWAIACLLFAIPQIVSAQSSLIERWWADSIILDNELGPNAGEQTGNYNPLILNDKPLNYTRFNIFSKGIMAVIKDHSIFTKAEKVPFLIYLRRDGELINQGASSSVRQVFSVEISDVLKLSQPGDHLIIEPARKADQKAKRILKIVVVIGGDGC